MTLICVLKEFGEELHLTGLHEFILECMSVELSLVLNTTVGRSHCMCVCVALFMQWCL